MSAGTLAAPQPARRAAAGPLLPAAPARLLAFAALALLGALHWMAMVSPSAGDRGVAIVAVGVALGAGLLAIEVRVPRALQLPAAAAVTVLAAVTAAVATGLDAGLLAPARWAELGEGVAQGIDGLGHASLPYAGADEWARLDLLLGGAILVVISAAAAFAPGAGTSGRLTAFVGLGVLFALPVIQVSFSAQFARGALFAALAIAFLWLERLPRRGAGAAGIVTIGAVVGALAIAPAVDGDGPWVDYESWSLSVSGADPAEFDWDHRYGPLDWPRDGKEVLRVRTRESAYWKTQTVDDFDGLRWRQSTLGAFDQEREALLAVAASNPKWERQARFVIRALRSERYVGAGTTLEILRPHPRRVAPSETFGSFRARTDLRRGDAYRARVYVPRPTAAQMTAAPLVLPTGELEDDLTIHLPLPGASARVGDDDEVPHSPMQIVFPIFGSRAPVLGVGPDGLPSRPGGAQLLRESPYARTYALAQRLRARARTPYGFVKQVQAHLGRGFSYTEDVPLRDIPLASFLFRDRAGYCQQFSGAMALLLRMGGVPARVAAGFAPGSYDRRRREYVVRDVDAHSWVEVWFSGYGWVPFDPTPAVAPATSQANALELPSAAGGDVRDVRRRPGGRGADPLERDGGSSGGWFLPVGLGLAGVTGVAGGVLLVRRRRREPPADPALAELERALRRTGRPPEPALTLRGLERRLAGFPGAAPYLRSLALARYGREAGAGPTTAERRALRVALGDGLGPVGRLRAWWALPPRLRGPRRA